MKNKYLTLILFPLFYYNVTQAQQLSLDSLLNTLKHSKTVNEKYSNVSVLVFQLWAFHPRAGLVDTLNEILLKLKTEAEASKDSSSLAGILRLQGQTIKNQAHVDSVLYYYSQALKIYIALKDAPEIAHTYKLLSTTNIKLNRFNTAVSYFFSALKIYEQIQDTVGIYNSYFSLGKIYHDREQHPRKAIGYFLPSLFPDSEISPFNFCFVSEEFIQLKKPDSALYYLTKAQPLLNNGIQFQLPYYYRALATYYQFTGQLDSATFYFLKTVDRFKYDKYNAVSSLFHLGEIAYKKNNFSFAEKYYKEAESYALNYHYFQLGRIYLGLAEVYMRQKQSEKALAMLMNYKLVSDSISKTEETDIMLASDLQHEFSIKEEDLKQAQMKKEFEKQELVKQQKLTTRIASGIILFILIIALLIYRSRKIIFKEKQRSDELLLNILPSEVAEELKTKGSAAAKQFNDVTVMFTDFKNFTQISEKLSPTELVNEIHTCFKAFDHIIGKHNIEKIKTIGDAYMCAGGLPVANKTNATDVVSASLEIQKFMQQHLQQRKSEGKEPFEIRIGIHTGPVVAGIVGVKKFAYDIWGDTVNIASRMESSSEAGKINISGSTYELVKDKFKCTHRGKIQAKNKGEIDMYFVELPIL